MSMLASDLAAIFADTSLTVPVVLDVQRPTESTRGFESLEDVVEPDNSGGLLTVTRRVVIVQDTALPALAKRQPITVDGVSYTIHDWRRAGRGKTRIYLAGGDRDSRG